MASSKEFTVTQNGEVTVITVAPDTFIGQMDTVGSAAVRLKALVAETVRSGRKQIIVDLYQAQVDTLTGWPLLVLAKGDVESCGGKLVLVVYAPEQLRKSQGFETLIARWDAFTHFETMEEALSSFTSSASPAPTTAIGEKGIAQTGNTEDCEDGGILRI